MDKQKTILWIAGGVLAVLLLSYILHTIGEIFSLASVSWIPWWGKYAIAAAAIFLGVKFVKSIRR